MKPILTTAEREIFLVHDKNPCCFLIKDKKLGGILINTPPFSPELQSTLARLTEIHYLFFPSHLGARDYQHWQQATGAESLAHQLESSHFDKLDIAIDNKMKLSRTIDFLPLSGVTPGSCALRIKNKPAIIFFGPTLQTGENGWPTVIPNENDFSYENRLIGAVALQDVAFEYAFTDDFQPGISHTGPEADKTIHASIKQLLE